MIRRSRSVGLGALLVLVGAVEVQAAPTVALRGQAPWVERLTPALLEVGLAIQSSTVGAAGWVAVEGEGELLRIRWSTALGPSIERTFREPRLGAVWIESQVAPPAIVELTPAPSVPLSPVAPHPGPVPGEPPLASPVVGSQAQPIERVTAPPTVDSPVQDEVQPSPRGTITASAPPAGRAALLVEAALASRLDDRAAWWSGARAGAAIPFETVWLGLRAEFLAGTRAIFRPQLRPNHLLDVQLVGAYPVAVGGLTIEPEVGLGLGAAWRSFLFPEESCSNCDQIENDNFAIGPRVSAGLGVVAPVSDRLDARLAFTFSWAPLYALEREARPDAPLGLEVAGAPAVAGGVQVGLRWRAGESVPREDRWEDVILEEQRLAAERRTLRDRSGELTTRFGAGISPSPGDVSTFLEACGNFSLFCFGGRLRVGEVGAAQVAVDGLAVAALPWRVARHLAVVPSLGLGLGYSGGTEDFGVRGELALSLEFPVDGFAPGVTASVGVGQPTDPISAGLAQTFLALVGVSVRVGA